MKSSPLNCADAGAVAIPRHGDEANHASEVEWLASVGVTKGWDMGNGTYQFRGTRNVARQDMAAFMYRLYTYLQSQG